MRSWLRRALTEDNPAAKGFRSDYDLNGEFKEQLLKGVALRKAAVLVPVIDREDETTILLTKRAEHLPKHPGQISFPGGTVEPSDDTIVATALRETEEEVGLDRSFVTVKGYLDGYRTGTGFEIIPVVGLVQPGFSLTLQEEEVSEAFEVPLSFILDRANHEMQSGFWKGAERHYYAMNYGNRNIWGATAAMLVNLVDVLEAVREET